MLTAHATAQPDTLARANRQRRVLPSGARLIMERLPAAETISVQVFWRTAELPLAWRRAGLPHLLEHLVGARVNDAALEKVGAVMLASTHREAIQFRFDGPAESLPVILKEIKGLSNPGQWAADDLRRERLTLREEYALLSPETRASIRAWHALSAAAPHPFGIMNELDRISVAEVADAMDFLSDPRRWTLSAAGKIDLETMEEKLSAAVPNSTSKLSEINAADPDPLNESASDAAALSIPEWSSPIGVARVAVALTLGSVSDRVRFAWTPTVGDTLATLSLREGTWLTFWTEMNDEAAEIIASAPLAASAWLAAQRAEPSSAAFLNGYLMSQDREAKVDDFAGTLQKLTAAEYERAWKTWRSAGVDR